jgi:hypothetical protein
VSLADGFNGGNTCLESSSPSKSPAKQRPGNTDGDGLYLLVASSTSRNWSYRYWFKAGEITAATLAAAAGIARASSDHPGQTQVRQIRLKWRDRGIVAACFFN